MVNIFNLDQIKHICNPNPANRWSPLCNFWFIFISLAETLSISKGKLALTMLVFGIQISMTTCFLINTFYWIVEHSQDNKVNTNFRRKDSKGIEPGAYIFKK